MSIALAVYRGLSAAIGAAAPMYLRARAREGKEDPARLGERYGRAYAPRPDGTLIWLHAASVGESGVAAQIIEALAARRADVHFLVSTGTRTSADLMSKRALARTLHVYAPLDRADCARRFMASWRPDLGVFVESELWPNLILEAQAAGVPLALVNARMSPATLSRWRSWRASARRLLDAFALILAADARTGAGLTQLSGRKAPVTGNLKLNAAAPAIDEQARAALAGQIGARPVWLAASTHPGEDEILLRAHARVRDEFPDALLVLAPRHPGRGEEVSALAGAAPRRSLGQDIGAGPVYVVDTMGELALFYALAPVAFVAGSLLPRYKGHNPIEPAKLGAAIIAGAYVESFEDLYGALRENDSCALAGDSGAIAEEVVSLLRAPELRAARVAGARAVVSRGAAALAQTIDQLEALAPRAAAQAKAADASA